VLRCCCFVVWCFSRKMNLTRGIDLKKIADKMSGSSGAELKACCTEAGMFALRERRVHVTQVSSHHALALRWTPLHLMRFGVNAARCQLP